jgi:hypothetical protein
MAEACCYGAAAKRGSPSYGAKHSRRDGNLSLAMTLAFLVKHEAQSIVSSAGVYVVKRP